MPQRDNSDEAIVSAVVDVVRPMVLEFFRADSCVATARIAIDTLDYFGISARPIPVEAIIYNDEASQILESGASLAELYQRMAPIPVTKRGGPWTLGLGMESDPNVEAGHVVVHVQSVDSVLDLALDQASRPQKGITLGPMRIPLGGGEFARDPGSIMRVEVPQEGYGPAHVEYRRAIKPRYQSSPNWRRTSSGPTGRSVFAEVTGSAIREIRKRLPG